MCTLFLVGCPVDRDVRTFEGGVREVLLCMYCIYIQRQILEVHDFHGLAFSKISRKQFSRTNSNSVSINTAFQNFAEINFQGSMPIHEKLENYALFSSDTHSPWVVVSVE